jgi:hypothetical protein
MQSSAPTVAAYLASLPDDRRAAVKQVRAVVRKNLDPLYAEGMHYGMISWFVPHRVFPAGYHCDPKQPLPFASLASQKNHLSLYLMPLYGDAELAKWFRAAWQERTGRKPDMGKCCVRFKTLDDLALDLIGEAVLRVPARIDIERYEAMLAKTRKSRPAQKR